MITGVVPLAAVPSFGGQRGGLGERMGAVTAREYWANGWWQGSWWKDSDPEPVLEVLESWIAAAHDLARSWDSLPEDVWLNDPGLPARGDWEGAQECLEHWLVNAGINATPLADVYALVHWMHDHSNDEIILSGPSPWEIEKLINRLWVVHAEIKQRFVADPLLPRDLKAKAMRRAGHTNKEIRTKLASEHPDWDSWDTDQAVSSMFKRRGWNKSSGT